jgi:hypothetical protein
MAALQRQLLALLALAVAGSLAGESAFTFVLGAGKSECFYETIPMGVRFEVEFQVSAGPQLERRKIRGGKRVNEARKKSDNVSDGSGERGKG